MVDPVHRLAPQYGVNPRLSLAVIQPESNFDPRAVSRRNAQGLTQLIPETSARFRGILPFAETRDYVKRIRKLFAQEEHPYDRSVTAPSTP